MKINELKHRPDIDVNVKLNEAYLQFEKFLDELRKRELPDEIVNSVNKDIDELNSIPTNEKELRNQIKKKLSKTIRLIEKELKLVPKNYYRNIWLAIGMAAFGIPIGVAFGFSLGNMALLGIGLPLGLVIGIAVGSGMDKKALEQGRQLDIEIRML